MSDIDGWERGGPWVKRVPYRYNDRDLVLKITITQDYHGFNWGIGMDDGGVMGSSPTLEEAKRNTQEIAKILIDLYQSGAWRLFLKPAPEPDQVSVASDNGGCPLCGSAHGVCPHPVDEVRKAFALLMRIPRAT